MKTHVISTAFVLCWGLLSGSALAGPDWNEGGADAGSTVGSKRVVSSAAGSLALSSVRGATAKALVDSDLCDLIELNIFEPLNFQFFPTADISFNAQLILFRGTDQGTGNEVGEPLLCFDNASSTDNQPRFDNSVWSHALGAFLHPMSDALNAMGESFVPGHYLIAVTSTGFLPYGVNASGDVALFDPPATGLGSRLAATVLHHWLGDAATGMWRFSSAGARFLPATSCETAEYVESFGERSVDNRFANDSSNLPDQCVSLSHDVWFRLANDCPGTIRIDTCYLVNFDSVIEVYRGSCDRLAVVACNDDGCGHHTGSAVTFTSMQCGGGGEVYFVRVGSRGDTPGGIGTIKFDCDAAADSPDRNGDGVVDSADLAIILSDWTTD